jgi:hypothetical protein
VIDWSFCYTFAFQGLRTTTNRAWVQEFSRRRTYIGFSILLGMAFITGEPGLTIPYQYPPPATADAGWQETSFISFTFLKTARDDGGGCGMTE